jgi:D-amino-acid oxidase
MSAQQDVVVVGAGVIGLAVAIELASRGWRVVVWHRDDPADTVSAVAGAIWYPFLCEPRQRVLAWSAATFRRLRRFAAEPGSGVGMQSVVEVFDVVEPDVWWAPAAERIERLHGAEVPAGAAAAIRTTVPVCDVPVHLPWLRRQAMVAGVAFVPRCVRTLDEAFAHGELVVNCTGLGAAALCGDRELLPVRGQVLAVAPPAGSPPLEARIDDRLAQPFYVIPRGADVVLGGTAQRGATDLAVDAKDTAAILEGIGERVPALRGAVPVAAKVGLRPFRKQVRLELEHRPQGRIVHCYGHGGAGYTLAWGCAEEVAALAVG